MMKKILTLLFCLTASVASAYQQTGFQVFIEVGYNKITLVNEANGQKGNSLNFAGPKLDNRWQDARFAFTPESDGEVCLRFGPGGEGDIPAYYEDIRVNGQPPNAGGWKFYPPSREGAQQGSVVSGKGEPFRLKVYMPQGTYVYIKVKKGERTEVSMRVKSGSFLDALNGRLADVIKNLDDAIRIGVPLEGPSLESGRKLAEILNSLGTLSESKLHVSVSPLPPGSVTLESLKAKTQEWINAFEAEKTRTAGEELPCLFADAEARNELKRAVIPVVRQSTKLQSACMLEFMFSR